MINKKRLTFVSTLLTSLFFFSLFITASKNPDGKVLYEKNCKSCHSIDGTGNPKIAKLLKVEKEQLNLTKKETREETDKELGDVIKQGRGKMKGKGDKLNDEEVDAIVKHIRILQKKAEK